jgi:hypothetical protein
MASADEFRAVAESFEKLVQTAVSKAEGRDFLDMAKTMRRAAAELDASARTVRQLDEPENSTRNPPRSAG